MGTLLDNWNGDEHISLQIQRIKDLFYFYEHEPLEITSIYSSYVGNAEAEVSAEAYYHLGLVELQKALSSNTSGELYDHCDAARQYLASSRKVIENRVDAEFFEGLVGIVCAGARGTNENIDRDIDMIAKCLSQLLLFSQSNSVDPYYVSLFRSAFGYWKILKTGLPSTWLDYRTGLPAVFNAFSEIKNYELKQRLSKGNLHTLFAKTVTSQFVEPYFALNFKAELNKLEIRLQEVPKDSAEGEFLQYLKSLLREEIDKKKHQADTLKEKLLTLTRREEPAVNAVLSRVNNPDDPFQVLNAYLLLIAPNANSFLNHLISACLKLQGNKVFGGDFSEDSRNTFISDLLSASGFETKDQTRWGSSASGKQPGEIDIYVYDSLRRPVTIIEALNLTSLDQGYLTLHIDKLFNYDTSGLPFNVILVYYYAPSLASFWAKYISFVQNHEYKYPLQSHDQIDDFSYADIKILRTIHLREGISVALYHIVVNMPGPPLT